MKYLLVLLLIIGIAGCAKKKQNNDPLMGNWVAVDSDQTIQITKKNTTYDHDIDLTDDSCEVQVQVDIENDYCHDMIFHYQEVNGKQIAVLSDTVFEADGRGTIVTEEYVKEENKNDLPDDFESDLCQKYNDTQAVPTYIED